MNKKLYKRDGRRFVPVEDLTGTIREVEGTRAICVLQTTTERYWAEVDDSNKPMSHYMALDYVKTRFNGKGILPTRSLLLILRDKYKEKIRIDNWCYWTADISESECSGSYGYAYEIGWLRGGIYTTNRSDCHGGHARAFFVENI